MNHKNIVSWFFETARKYSNRTCFLYKHGSIWKSLSWEEVLDLVHQYSRGLMTLGVREGTPVALLAGTRMEWTLLDLAILAAGGITVPIYANLPDDQISFIIKDSKTKIAIVENEQMLEKLLNGNQARVEDYNSMIIIEGCTRHDNTFDLTALIEKGQECKASKVDEIVANIDPNSPASYIYTSGTTGLQKGAIITHGNILAENIANFEMFDFGPDEVCLVFLPFAHVLGRAQQFFLLTKGCVSAYAEGVDKIADNYLEIKPHFVVGVPRMLEKVVERVEAIVAHQPRYQQVIFNWAKKVGEEVAGKIQRRFPIDKKLAFKYFFAKKLIFNKLHQKLGGRMLYFMSGGAPLDKSVAKFFLAAGIQVLEGYGLTETFAAVTANRLNDFHFGTVGKPIKGVDIRLADDGEILVRGPMVFQGYLNDPQATAITFEGEWLKTGDIGEFSKEGFLRIVDRKKDIIITAGGKNIAPQRIETLLTQSPFINHAMVYGDKKKYLTALLTLNDSEIKKFAQREGILYSSFEALAEHPTVKKLIEGVIAEKNKHLARFETIKRFKILAEDFSTETGEITPTLKIRRKFVIGKYQEELDLLYRD